MCVPLTTLNFQIDLNVSGETELVCYRILNSLNYSYLLSGSNRRVNKVEQWDSFGKVKHSKKKKSPCLQLFKSKTKEVKQSRERVNRFIFASSVYTLFYTLSYLFSLWWNEQTTAAAAAAAGSRHNIFNNDTISSFYTSFASHIANKTATAWNTTTTTTKKKGSRTGEHEIPGSKVRRYRTRFLF